MSARDLKGARARAWVTRRAKYGPSGHHGSYARTARSLAPCASCRRMADALIRLHTEEVLSKGQVAKMTGLGRVEIRIRADELAGGVR